MILYINYQMKSKFLDYLSVQRDEDMRVNSFHPLAEDELKARFTQFIRKRDVVDYQNKQSKIIFTNKIPNNTEKPFNEIIKRYHDQSFTCTNNSGKFKIQSTLKSFWNKSLNVILRDATGTFYMDRKSLIILCWNILISLAYVFNWFQIPISLFLTEQVYIDQFDTVVGLFFNWFFIAVIAINIFVVRPITSIQSYGYEITNRERIMQNYVGFPIFIETLCLVILIIYAAAYNPQLIYLKLFFYISFLTIYDIEEMIISKLQIYPYRFAFYRMIRLLLQILFLIIWISSIFFYIDYVYYVQGTYPPLENWLTYSSCTLQLNSQGQQSGTDLIQTYPGQWYIWLTYAAYWSLQTISTVGYGDITPRNPNSVVFTNISILIFMFSFVIFINIVIQIIDETTTPEQKQKESYLRKFKFYFQKTKNNMTQIQDKYNYSEEQMQKKYKNMEYASSNIRNYLYEMEIKNIDDHQSIEQILQDNLTPQLREKLFLSHRHLFFKKIVLFGEVSRISSDFLEIYDKLTRNIKEVSYGYGEIVYLQGQYENNSLYYLLKGSVLLKYPFSNYQKMITYLQEEQEKMIQASYYVQKGYYNFGVRQFFTRQAKHHHAITQSYSRIHILEYKDFIQIMKEHRKFYTKYCEVKDQIKENSNNLFVGEECFQCKSKEHHLLHCKACVFNMKQLILHKLSNQDELEIERGLYNISIKHERKKYIRDQGRQAKKVILKDYENIFKKINIEQIRNYSDYNPLGNINKSWQP